MSKKDLRGFIDKINESKELMSETDQYLEGGADMAGFVELGKSHGFEFSIEEANSLRQSISGAKGLDAEQLGAVGGGRARRGTKLPSPGKIGIDTPGKVGGIKWTRCW